MYSIGYLNCELDILEVVNKPSGPSPSRNRCVDVLRSAIAELDKLRSEKQTWQEEKKAIEGRAAKTIEDIIVAGNVIARRCCELENSQDQITNQHLQLGEYYTIKALLRALPKRAIVYTDDHPESFAYYIDVLATERDEAKLDCEKRQEQLVLLESKCTKLQDIIDCNAANLLLGAVGESLRNWRRVFQSTPTPEPDEMAWWIDQILVLPTVKDAIEKRESSRLYTQAVQQQLDIQCDKVRQLETDNAQLQSQLSSREAERNAIEDGLRKCFYNLCEAQQQLATKEEICAEKRDALEQVKSNLMDPEQQVPDTTATFISLPTTKAIYDVAQNIYDGVKAEKDEIIQAIETLERVARKHSNVD